MSRTGPAEDRAVLAFAQSQHGVVTRSQLDALGIGRHALAQRLEAGRLHRVHQGVYALGRPQLTPNGHRLAAVLACGPSAVL
ncbi:MAG: type IV toxin-antitoxin system AbiEi family antitoxin domain-containing protein, partial [Solirubrobacteraceae bacterium]